MRIETEGLTVRLGGVPVLGGIDVAAEPGEVTALIGPNGSGKTTLLRAVAGLVPHGGTVRFDGRTEGDRNRVAYMAQDTVQRPVLTVLEVVLLGRLGRLGYRIAQADMAAADAALRAVGVERFAGRLVGDLSGGQRQLVQFAQILAREPAVALLDEPTSALDMRHQLQLLDLVRREARARSITTIVSLHDLNAAARFADRIVVLRQGKVEATGPPGRVLDPALIARVYGVEARFGETEDGLPTINAVRALPVTPDGRPL